VIQTKSATVYIGNNLDILPTLPDNSVDSIVTDPPYELGFMGKSWDSSGIAYNVDLWRECWRVLKPGGHLLSFGGTRTWHRIAVAIEDAGFEVRDSIAWMYGSGFPKSLDVSKAIDKQKNDSQENAAVAEYLLHYNKFGSISAFREFLNFNILGKNHSGGSAQEWTTTNLDAKTLKRCPTWEQWLQLKSLLNLDDTMDAEVWRLNGEKGEPGEAYKNREVLGTKTSSLGGTVAAGERNQKIIDYHKTKIVDITAPATPEAQQWEGWGTALKPAFEPVIVARKPLIGTVAANVLEHGTGALNIDGSRIGTEGGAKRAEFDDNKTNSVYGKGLGQKDAAPRIDGLGRWPANVMLDEYSAGLLDEQSGVSKSPPVGSVAVKQARLNQLSKGDEPARVSPNGHGDSGGASRFFYVAKASKRDRNEGLEGLPEVRTGAMSATQDGTMLTGSGNERTTTRQNFHPTVKPTTLMRYLVKLVTPPGGTVLDPFTGSGSTGKAAILEGFTFIGCEMTEDYVPIIQGRLEHAEATAAAEKDKRDEALF
jgi:DNA modification methylase